MIITKLRCENCYKEFDYSYLIWCNRCKKFISAKLCKYCHDRKYHREPNRYIPYEERAKKYS